MSEQYLIVRIADRRVAFRASEVHSVIELESITPVPMAPPHVAGLAAMRSNVLTIIDCRRALGLDEVPARASRTTTVVVEYDGYLYGLAVDGHEDVSEADHDPDSDAVSFGARWDRVAHGMVEAVTGAALLVDVSGFVRGPEVSQAA